MEVANGVVWECILGQTKMAQEKGSDPLLWSIGISSTLRSAGITSPSPELANHLVSHICWENNVPIAWKFLEKALLLKIVPPLLVLALLSTRVIPYRHSCPAAFKIYMELIKRHAFSLKESTRLPNYQKTMHAIDEAVHLSHTFGLQANDASAQLVLFIFSIIWQLIDSALDDEGLLQISEQEPKWPLNPQDMDVDGQQTYRERKKDFTKKLQAINTVMAIELTAQFFQHKVTSRILHLARQNMRAHWESFIQRVQLLVENSTSLRNSKSVTPEVLLQLILDTEKTKFRNLQASLLHEFDSVFQSRPRVNSGVLCLGTSRSTLWLPLDMLLEDAMDGSQVNSTSAVEIITGLVKSLQAINAASWHDTFLGLWMSALRLVQRERDPIEGPVPRLDTRLSMLLSITTLVASDLIEEEESASTDRIKSGVAPESRRTDLIFSIQSLHGYQSLLVPPQSVIPAANQAATKAMMFVSGVNVGTAYFECISSMNMPIKCSGSLHHLIVEACIARNLLDTSAYFWPGYVNGRINQLPHNVPSHVPGWSSFMKGASLSPVMINALASTPASSFAEVEKVFEIAVNGSSDERIAAATILCGASLIRGWNIQEHTVYFITRLLSPPVPVDYSDNESHLISYAPMLNVLLLGVAPFDCVQIFSLHGVVPELAASLMTICEVFGSCVPNISWGLPTGEEISAHAVFTNAFTLLLKLWRFNHPPLEYGVGDVPPAGSQLTPENLLLVRNSHLVSSGEQLLKDPNRRRLSQVVSSSSCAPIFVDSFPKLKVWYRQHLACIASPLTGLVNGTLVHRTVDALLHMMFRRINGGNQSGSSGSSNSSGEDDFLRPKLPAWDILEAVPFVADAALTACAHGRLSPRELCTGMKDLADYLPATLATIVSYFSAEVTRGVWKSVFMNGSDWPSPAANLSNVEEQIKKILAATGVDVPSLAAAASSPAALPLPLAAFVSLTITYKLDKASQRFLDLAGPALESLAAGCPWPCMPIVASLWTQKAKRWSDFLVFSASRTVFLHSNDAVVQLLKSCFAATLGSNDSSNGGVGPLLGHGFGSHCTGGISPVAPGILYLRVFRSIRDIMFLREEIVSLLMQTVEDSVVCTGTGRTRLRVKYGHASFSVALAKVKLAASLGASLMFLTGGLGLVQSLIKETLPSWFMSGKEGFDSSGFVRMLRGYALAYLAVFSGAFIWGTDSSASRRRPKILGYHLEFVASALDGKISLGCDSATWRAYVSGFLSLMVKCTPCWVSELGVDLLRRLCVGLRRWNEEELALALLGVAGAGAMGPAAELILDTDV